MTNYFKKFHNYLKKDTWDSWLVSLVLIIVFIKLIFFPTLTLITNSPLPLVVIESCSMYHSASFDSWWEQNSVYYENRGITKENFQEYQFKNGMNKGDIIFLWNRGEIERGDIIVFQSDSKNPIIHRTISLNPIETKGDNNSGQLPIETNIKESQIIGKSAGRIPYIGWLKLIFYEPFRTESQRGFCH